ncbi:DNA-binding transcriptional regulator, LysR family [Cyclobacterium lianum]|uniref:DNA-binding transcriptional regulator, LysR family n=1 Tax=Cyclobacterium lianum TaxID=388280 RepID=A0A1M7PVM0_9BACT|nr:LysR family transcriptional regulator [Cyclobacterium lianum]SHN21583.1 DNA-binding transcriptional regulator, LysR family [Cyclobacterium lianum]
MHYTLNQLQVFLKVAQTQSVTKTAEALHLTQPAISIQLKNFQDQFDIPLTEVVGRKIYITEFGKEIAQAAEEIINQVNAINQKTLQYKGQLAGRLKITIVSTAKYVMPYFLSDFLRRHQGIELLMDVTNKLRVIDSLADNEVDFSMVSILPEKLQLEHIDLMPNKLYLVGSANARYDETRPLSDQLNELNWIYREKGSGTRQMMEAFVEQNHWTISKKLELTSNEAVKQAVIAGLGFSIMPLIGIKNELNNGDLKIYPIEGLPLSTMWQLVWMKGKNHNPVTKAFLNYIRMEAPAIIKKKFEWYIKY